MCLAPRLPLLVAALLLAVAALLLPRLLNPYPYNPRPTFLFDLPAARRGETYGVCDAALLSRLRGQVDAHRDDKAFKEQIRSGAVFCGTQRTLMRRKVPWSGCFEALASAKSRLLDQIERLCIDQQRAVEMLRSSGNQSLDAVSSKILDSMVRPAPRGVVFTGLSRHFEFIFRAVLQLRAVNCSLPVEVFVNPDLLPECTASITSHLRSVRCRSLPGRTVGYVAKFHALLLSSFVENIFVNAGVLFVRNPTEVLDSPDFRTHGAVLFPDDWGEQCRLDAASGNAAAAQFGQTAWSTHVLFKAEVGGLSWRPERAYAQAQHISFSSLRYYLSPGGGD